MKIAYLCFVLGLALLAAGQEAERKDHMGSAQALLIPDLARELNLNQLLPLIDPELLQLLQGPGPFTFFAPSNEAIRKFMAGSATIDMSELNRVLRYHIVPGLYASSALRDGQTLPTLEGDSLVVHIRNSGQRRSIMINDANILTADRYAPNGVVHIIDSVLLPPSISSGSEGSGVDSASRIGRGGSAMLQEEEPVEVKKGSASAIEQPQAAPFSPKMMMNLLEVAKSLNLNTFVAALQATEMAVRDLLQGNDQYTVFAPSEEAWARLGQRTINALLADPIRLRQVLLHHIAAGVIPSATLRNGKFTALDGEQLTITRSMNSILIDNARVTSPDHIAMNGILHVIDHVLIPPSLSSSLTEALIPGESGSALNVLIPELLQRLGLAHLSTVLTDELKQLLSGRGPYTLFAPSEAAWNRISAQTLAAIVSDPIRLRQLILYHVVPGLYPSNSLKEGQSLTTLEGRPLTVSMDQLRRLRVNEALIIDPNHFADNGIVHIIDSILLPPTGNGLPTLTALAQQLGLNSFLAAVRLADQGLWQTLDSQFGPYTVFAPSDEAFTRLTSGSAGANLLNDPIRLRHVMFYHLLFGSFPSSSLTTGLINTLADEPLQITRSGSSLMINDAMVTSADHIAQTGIIHVVDNILLPPSFTGAILSGSFIFTPEPERLPTAPGSSMGSAIVGPTGSGTLVIPDVARSLRLTRFIELLNRAGLEETLRGTGPYTVFAPTDEAFGRLQESVASALGNNAILRQVLLYHVVPGLYPASSFISGQRLSTAELLSSVQITIPQSTNTVHVNNARVLLADQAASNGIIHEIDQVLLPILGATTFNTGSAVVPVAPTTMGPTDTTMGPTDTTMGTMSS